MKKGLLWIFLFVFIDVLGFSLILPLLPYVGEEFKVRPTVMGLALTSNAIAQMVAAPYIGSLSDVHGRKPLLLICIFGTLVSFVILGRATTVWELFFSRILDGLLGGNISLAQAYISDITEYKDRSKGFGVIGAAFGLGFIFGPAIGGALSNYGFRIPAYCSALIALINFIGVLFWLPESLPPKESRNPATESTFTESTSSSLTNWIVMFSALEGTLRNLMILRFFYNFCFTLFETSFAFYNLQRLGLPARQSSYLLAYFGVIFSLVQGAAIRLKVFQQSEGKSIAVAATLLSVSFMLWSVATDVYFVIACLFLLACSSGLLNTLINSQITKHVEQTRVGSALGISASIGSLTRIIAPMSSGILIDQIGVWSPGICGAVLMASMTAFCYNRGINTLSSTNMNASHDKTR